MSHPAGSAGFYTVSDFMKGKTMTQAAHTAGREAVHHKIHAPLGHDAFLVQRDPQTDLIRDFLG